MYLTGTNGDDILVGGADADTLLGLNGDDTLQGGEGDDLLVGGNGDDTLQGQGGADTLQGERGDDLLIGGAGSDTLDGGAGNDTVSYADADPAPAMSFLMIHLGGSAWELGPTPSPWTDTLVSIENAIGSVGVDWMVGTTGDNKLYGGAGNDKLEGKGGADVLDGGDGNDALTTDSYFDPTQAGSLLIGGDGDDSLGSGNSNDTMLGGAGNDSFSVRNYATTRIVDGGTGADTLAFTDGFTTFASGVVIDLNKTGSQAVASGVAMTITGVENLTGSNAGDTLIGDAGANVLSGGNGDDLLVGGAGNDKLDGGAGSDTVSYADVVGAGMLLINLSAQSVTIMGPTGFENDTLVSIENAIGSSGADWLVGSSGDNKLYGGAGNDNIDGKGGADILDGGDGNDFIATTGIFGAAAPGSLLIGGDGNDSLQSGNSNDTLQGGAGDDALSLGDYATTRIVDGGDGTDLLAFSQPGFAAGVTVDLNKTTQTIATDVVITLTNVENVNGSNAGDTLIGDAGVNVIYGWGDDDALYGGAGADAINGGDGADRIVGGAGQDQLRGESGADTFVFAPGDSDFSASDTINDFTAEDRIQFTDGPAGDAGNYAELETTDFLAVDALFAADGVRYVAMSVGSSLYVFADTGEEGTTYDSLIVLTGANLSSIDAGSFLAA